MENGSFGGEAEVCEDTTVAFERGDPWDPSLDGLLLANDVKKEGWDKAISSDSGDTIDIRTLEVGIVLVEALHARLAPLPSASGETAFGLVAPGLFPKPDLLPDTGLCRSDSDDLTRLSEEAARCE